MGRTPALHGHRRALVVGLGRSGTAAARALHSAGVEVLASDARPDVADRAALQEAGIDVHAGRDGDDLVGLLDAVDLVVPSPGVPQHAPVLRAALDRGVDVWSEPELGWRLAPHPLVAITGTNGKTTVTQLVGAMLDAAGATAATCGNIGRPFTTAALETSPETLLVAELSSFQLRFSFTLRPAVGVLLNLSVDHLDWHGDAAAYRAAKARLWQAQRRDDWAVGNADDPCAAAVVTEHAPGLRAWTSVRDVPEVGVGIAGGELIARLPGHDAGLCAVDELPGGAPHQVANVAAAACAALLAGAGRDAVVDAARSFRPGPHRLQVVARRGGVTWVDDSKATNPHAAAAALATFPPRPGGGRHVVWIAGGVAKGLDLSALAGELAAVRQAVLIGEAAGDLAAVAAAERVPALHAASIEEAVAVADAAARAGDTVLLAPACASFDQFRDYAERGERFAAAVASLPPRRGEEPR